MRSIQFLKENWSIAQLDPQEKLDFSVLPNLKWLNVPKFPMQVQDVLLHEGLLPQEVLVGWCDEAKWIAEYDWVYQCEFEAECCDRPTMLRMMGVDTVADIYLNGEKISNHDDFFLPNETDVTGKLQKKNVLTVHFHNIEGEMPKYYYNPEWEGLVDHWKVLRKPGHDRVQDIPHGSNYQGAHPYFTPIGLYDDVKLDYMDSAAICGDHIVTELTQNYYVGHVKTEIDIQRFAEGEDLRATFMLEDEDGTLIRKTSIAVGDQETVSAILSVNEPKLWYPRGFGEHPLYRITVSLGRADAAGKVCEIDRLSKLVGFKDVQMVGDLQFVINGKNVRLWGGSMDPFQGYTHVWQPDRVDRLLLLVENAHMNTLRCWGEGIPYKDEFYEETDRRGILVWQEFFLGFNAYPDDDNYRKYIRAEGEYLVKRIRHHASLLMWCGGNETRMGSEFTDRNRPFYGEVLVTKDLPEIVARLDPGRYYHEGSPSIGRWANDPEVGDHHTYDCVWQYHGTEYPNFVSEHIRTSPPVMHSLKAIVREEDFWPEDYTGMLTYQDRFPLPPSWMERVNWTSNMHLKTGPIWEYYDANTPEEMLYRFGASYAQEMRDGLERVRMGSREGGLGRKRRSRGHFSCKLNDTWPKCYCAVIDFFGEGYMPYYATKRGQEPVLVCFDNHDSINLWLVNDSAEDIKGTVTFALFNPATNQFSEQKDIPVFMPQGEGDIVLNLDYLYFFPKNYLLYAKFTDENGVIRNFAIDSVDVERHQRFPEAKLDVHIEGDELVITTDKYARCIEIYGNEDGDQFGWLFEDNFFDLLPGDTKRIKILGRHTKGVITLKPHYSPNQETLQYQLEK